MKEGHKKTNCIGIVFVGVAYYFFRENIYLIGSFYEGTFAS